MLELKRDPNKAVAMEAGDVPESEVNMNTTGDDAQPVAEQSTTIENPTASAEQQSTDSKKTSSRHKYLELLWY